MRMGSAGVGLGAGVQNYRLVILFETEAALNKFVDGSSWDAATSAQAAAGKSGVNVASSFVDNVAIFQLTNKGLMAQADLTGTRFWKSDELNL
jgi:lipid-binding SYLF domain-containing protein